jgi:nuclease HARBI1
VIVAQVSTAIAKLKNEYIYMPRSPQELISKIRAFYNISNFPTVIRTIDCTHIKISGQGGEDGELFRNRKQFFSINVQSVSSADLKFQDIVANWPGSCHDSHIFNQSRLKQRLESGEFQHGTILGDGGYKLESYLMTPFRNPATGDEMRYNRVQILVRNTVEQKYGVWKRRFPCLVFGLRCKLETSLVVIVACAVLHNICVHQGDLMPPVDADIEYCYGDKH